MKILKFLWLLPTTIILIIYAIYYIIKVYNNSNIIELQLMGSKEIAKEIFEKWFKPILTEHRTSLRIFSTIIWIGLIFYIK